MSTKHTTYKPGLIDITFPDGTTVPVVEAARIIVNREKVGDGMMGTYQDAKGETWKTFAFWRQYGDRFAFQSTSGSTLAWFELDALTKARGG